MGQEIRTLPAVKPIFGPHKDAVTPRTLVGELFIRFMFHTPCEKKRVGYTVIHAAR